MKKVRIFTLDLKGVIAAIALGLAVLVLGGYAGPYFLFVLLFFLILSAAATEIGKEKKKELGTYEKARSWKNVVANGLVALFIACAYRIDLLFYFAPKLFLVIAYTASMSGVTADKFASEIGVLDGDPVMLLNLKKVRKGTSGAITILGTLASMLGSFLLSLSLLLLQVSWAYIILITAFGFVGSIVDSIAGYFEEKGKGNKYTSNLLCAISSTLLAIVII